MELIAEQDDGLNVVRVVATRIDAAVAIQFKDRMREAAAALDGRVVLDLQQVDFIDSSGLGAIVAAMKLMPPGRKLELAGLTAAVDKVFRMTRMDTIFAIHDSVASARAAHA